MKTLSNTRAKRAAVQSLVAIAMVQAAEQSWADDGALDTSWSLQVPLVNSGALHHVFVDPEGNILLSGAAHVFASVADLKSLIRLHANGSLDTNFAAVTGDENSDNGVVNYNQPVSLVFQSDGKIVYGGADPIPFGRLNADGSRDFGRQFCWGPSSAVNCLALQPDGKILIGGGFDGQFLSTLHGCDPNGPFRHQLARFTSDGCWDLSFDAGLGLSSSPYPSEIKTVVLQPDGKILVGGAFGLFNGQLQNGVVRLNCDGSLDSSFTLGWAAQFGNVNVNRLAVLADGKILIGGAFSGILNGAGFNGGILRLNSDGTVDSSFVPSQQSSYVDFTVLDFVMQADGRILIGGLFRNVGGVNLNYLARLNPDGSLDTTFDADLGIESGVVSLALQDEGHLLVAGSFSRVGDFALPHVLSSDVVGVFPTVFGPASAGEFTVARMLTAPSPLVITAPPQSQAAILGSSVVLSISATGSKPLSYRWRKNGTDIVGQSGRTLTLSQISAGDAGDYDVVVSNRSESINSTACALAVLSMARPISYSMLNGSGLHDETYSGAGNPNADLSSLSGGLGQLVDGVLAPYSCDTGGDPIYDGWVGWYTVDPEITFDFGQRQNFSQVSIYTQGKAPGAVVFSTADISFSDDGVSFGGSVTYAPRADERSDGVHWIRMPVAGSGQFVRVKLHNPFPGWSSFIMISEVSFGQTPNVSKVDPIISWSNPDDIVYGTLLGEGQLNATASVPGAFTYVPPAGAVLSAGPNQTLAVTFTPDDSAHYNTASASVSLNVLPVNHPPVANADTYTTLENTTLHVAAPGLLANDTDPDGDALSVSEVRVPDHGSIFADPDGSFTYTPAPNYIGPDSFRYIISDSYGAKATNFAFVTVMIPAVSAVQTSAAHPGDTVTVSTAPSVAGQAGVSATVENTGGAPVGLTVADYSSNPSVAAFSADGGFTDVQIVGADSTMTATANFYYPSTIDPAREAALTLFYYNGDVWVQVRSDGNANPPKDTTDNLDGTISGGRFMVLFSSTSTPKITALNGTFFAVGVLDIIPPTISCQNVSVPCGIDLLAPVAYPVAAVSDNVDLAPKVVYSVPSGSAFPVGTTVVSCTATDASGNSASTSFTVTRAALGFSGFLSPIGGADAKGGTAANPVGTFKLGSTIPVKFNATCGGSAVLIGAHKLQALKYSGSTTAGTPIDATPQDAAGTGNEFRLTGGEWHFNLDTKGTGLSIGVWQLIATLSDGSQHSVWIQLK